jgi:hypothetical protein
MGALSRAHKGEFDGKEANKWAKEMLDGPPAADIAARPAVPVAARPAGAVAVPARPAGAVAVAARPGGAVAVAAKHVGSFAVPARPAGAVAVAARPPSAVAARPPSYAAAAPPDRDDGMADERTVRGWIADAIDEVCPDGPDMRMMGKVRWLSTLLVSRGHTRCIRADAMPMCVYLPR